MKIDDPTILSLKAKVEAAREEFDLATTFHEVWKPTAFDSDLKDRMGLSYATNAFQVISIALRREMLLALMRIWDRNDGTVRVHSMMRMLDDKDVIRALATRSAARFDCHAVRDAMLSDIHGKVDAAKLLVNKYDTGGESFTLFETLRRMRNKNLAHRDIKAYPPAEPERDDVQKFYEDTCDLIIILMSVVLATSYDPRETARIRKRHAELFWIGVRGEKTEGHPNFRAVVLTKQIADNKKD